MSLRESLYLVLTITPNYYTIYPQFPEKQPMGPCSWPGAEHAAPWKYRLTDEGASCQSADRCNVLQEFQRPQPKATFALEPVSEPGWKL